MSKADDLRTALATFFSGQLGGDVVIDDLKRFSGGASRETWSFAMKHADGEQRVVFRRDPPGRPSPSAEAEIALLTRAHDAGVPAPRVLWVADGGDVGNGYFMNHVDGETIARKILRDDEFANARTVMAAQMGAIAARIHSIDPAGVRGLEPPQRPPAEAVLDQYATLLDTFGEPHPVFELALRRLRTHPPASDRITVVHGDYRNGNFIVGPDGVAAVLDWELVHLGDPWEDLAWVCTRSWRFGGAGEVGGFGDREDLYRAYEGESGIPVDRAAVHWWEVMSSVKWGVMTIGQAFTHLFGHVKSMELAAIGRRTAETEFDVMELLRTGAM